MLARKLGMVIMAPNPNILLHVDVIEQMLCSPLWPVGYHLLSEHIPPCSDELRFKDLLRVAPYEVMKFTLSVVV